jgi:hypothetical protein
LSYSLDRTAKTLVTSIDKREFLESLEEGEEIIPE